MNKKQQIVGGVDKGVMMNVIRKYNAYDIWSVFTAEPRVWDTMLICRNRIRKEIWDVL